MNRIYFNDCISEIFASQGRQAPGKPIQDAIFKRVESMPDIFMGFAVAYFQETTELPKNMGRYLLRDLWPKFLTKHPELKGHSEIKCCPLCDTGSPGWRRVWEPEVTGWGQKVYKPVHVRCTCGGYPNPNQERVYHDFELEQMGYRLDCPYEYDRDNPPEFLRRAMDQKDSGEDKIQEDEDRRFCVYVE